PAVGMPDDVCDRLIHRQRYCASVLFRKTDNTCNGRNRSPDAAKHLWITQKLQPQKKLPPWQGHPPVGGIVTESRWRANESRSQTRAIEVNRRLVNCCCSCTCIS